QVVGLLGPRCEGIRTNGPPSGRVRGFAFLHATLNHIRPNADAVRGIDPSRTRRATFPARTGLAPQIHAVDPSLDHLEIRVTTIDPRMVQGQICRRIASDQSEWLRRTPA